MATGTRSKTVIGEDAKSDINLAYTAKVNEFNKAHAIKMDEFVAKMAETVLKASRDDIAAVKDGDRPPAHSDVSCKSLGIECHKDGFKMKPPDPNSVLQMRLLKTLQAAPYNLSCDTIIACDCGYNEVCSCYTRNIRVYFEPIEVE